MTTHDAIRHVSLNAHVANWANLGAGCVVHDFALVGRLPSVHHALARQPAINRWLAIGTNVEIGPHSTIYGGVVIGNDCFIGDSANVREEAVIGKRCVIGAYVTVSFGCHIEDDVRIQSHTHVTDGARIGEGTFIGVGVTMASDRRREVVEYVYREDWCSPPIIGKRCLIGSGACLVPGVRIGDDAVIGAGALVVKDVPAGATVLGQPARVRGYAEETERQLAAAHGSCMTGKVA